MSRYHLPDTRPLRNRAFSWLWLGNAISVLGGYIGLLAITLQIYRLTGSPLAVGLGGLFGGLPAVILFLFSGSLADRVDRRRLVLLGSSGQLLICAALTLQSAVHLDALWLLYAALSGQSLFGAINSPARKTFAPRLLPKDELQAAAALQLASTRLASLVGPLLGGALVAAWGLQAGYAADGLSYLPAILAVALLPAMEPAGNRGRRNLEMALEGLRYILKDRLLLSLWAADLSMTLLTNPAALLPALDATRFGGSPEILGALMAAMAVGGLSLSLLSELLGRVSRVGFGVLASCGIAGLAAMLLGLATRIWLATTALALLGAADTALVILRTALVQARTDDRYLGRVGAADYLVGTIGPKFGDLRAGAMGSLISPAGSLLLGGVAALSATLALGMGTRLRWEKQASSSGMEA